MMFDRRNTMWNNCQSIGVFRNTTNKTRVSCVWVFTISELAVTSSRTCDDSFPAAVGIPSIYTPLWTHCDHVSTNEWVLSLCPSISIAQAQWLQSVRASKVGGRDNSLNEYVVCAAWWLMNSKNKINLDTQNNNNSNNKNTDCKQLVFCIACQYAKHKVPAVITG